MASAGKPAARSRRDDRERARRYEARARVHQSRIDRRRRDSVIGVSVGLVLVLGAIGAQAAYFGAGPGATSPTPSPSVTPADPSAPATDAPAPTAEPSATTTPTD